MEYVQGIDLASAWMTDGCLSEGQKKTILQDIADYVRQLRKLAPPVQGMVSSALQNPVYDCRIGSRAFGPLRHDDFHALLRGQLHIEDCTQVFGAETTTVYL